uniref:Uncharacterized protein n=1 Tax=Lotharella globosa TaxID=91324 RepID=A0A6V3P9N9_9EUKA|mmetsp:Transcript_10008/g.19773  ORF Transcript_10008/g.19773 Transcript_10008/m.19773 type:complete len:336 (-) Transcript_10008:961-1968(-)
MDVIGKTYASYYGERHPSRRQSSQKQRTESPIKQMWEVKKRYNGSSRSCVAPTYRTKQTAEVWIRPETPSDSMMGIVSARKHNPRNPKVSNKISKRPQSSRGSRPVSASGFMKRRPGSGSGKKGVKPSKPKQRAARNAWEQQAKEAASKYEEELPTLNTKMPEIGVPKVVKAEDITKLAKKIEQLETVHNGPKTEGRQLHQKFRRAIEMEQDQAEKMTTGKKHMMVPGGIDRPRTKGAQSRDEEITMVKDDIQEATKAIDHNRSAMKSVKKWNSTDRELWKLKVHESFSTLLPSHLIPHEQCWKSITDQCGCHDIRYALTCRAAADFLPFEKDAA